MHNTFTSSKENGKSSKQSASNAVMVDLSCEIVAKTHGQLPSPVYDHRVAHNAALNGVRRCQRFFNYIKCF